MWRNGRSRRRFEDGSDGWLGCKRIWKLRIGFRRDGAVEERWIFHCWEGG